MRTPNKKYLQSYKSLIASISSSGEVLLDENNYDYSRTTTKHLGIFLRQSAKTIHRKIKTGEYKLVEKV
jgi:hypothetical protein